jgi:glycosyltransferase involved in cell wall biosynthesis
MIPFISIIIPTYNRANYIAITLNSFLNQSYNHKYYEIIVVNNNSTDNTQAILDEFISKNPSRIRSIFESRQGVHYARNKAAKLAIGEILYYTDDDMIADVDLLENIIKPFAYDKEVASVTGKVLPKWESGKPPTWILKFCSNGLLSLNFKRNEELIISINDVNIYSCHQALRKDVFLKSGGFNPENTAGEWIGDGETGLNIKIKNLGYKFGYISTAITEHIIPKERTTQKYLNRRYRNQANCDSYAQYRVLFFEKKELNMPNIIMKNYILCLKNIIYVLIKFILKNDSWHLNLAKFFYHKQVVRYFLKVESNPKFKALVLRSDWLND